VVRIIIETDQETTVRSQEEAPTSPQEPAAPATTDQQTAPAEVLAAAAAIGARDAGPAPTGPPAGGESGAPTLPVAASPDAPVAGSDDLTAGAAPGTQPEPPPTVVSEEGE
jgi:hypothetical protein